MQRDISRAAIYAARSRHLTYQAAWRQTLYPLAWFESLIDEAGQFTNNYVQTTRFQRWRKP
jgi:hypothetical protein